MSITTRVEVVRAEVKMTVALTVMDCSACGVIYGIPAEFNDRRKSDGKTLYCPNGHGQSYQETDADRLRAKLAGTMRQLDYANDTAKRIAGERDQAKASLTATKGVVTRMKRRAMAGACVYCHRPFPDLREHMAATHPDVTLDTDPAEDAPTVPADDGTDPG